MHEFMPLEQFLVFFAVNMPISLLHLTHSKNLYRGATNARVYASETISCFVATNMPNPLFPFKTHVLRGPCHFVDALDTLQKLVSRCI